MNIQYFEKERIFKIDTKNTSYVMGIIDKEGFLGHMYYGAYVEDYNLRHLLRVDEYPFTPERLYRERSNFLDHFCHEYPGNMVGDFRESGIEIEDYKNHNAVSLFYEAHSIQHGKEGIRGLPATFGVKEDLSDVMTLSITLKDPVNGMKVLLIYSIFEGLDVIVRRCRIINSGTNEFRLTKAMSMCLDMPDDDFKMLSLQGSWARERIPEYRTIGHGKQSVGSVCGKSSATQQPFVALVSRDISQTSGEVYGFHFVYSGNFLGQIEKNDQEQLRIMMGIHPQNFKYIMNPGDVFETPEVVLVYSDEGLGKMSRTLHDLYRNHLIRSSYKNKPRPILINNWEATYFDFNTDKLLDIARCAKDCGIEMLVMDDGWFGKREDDSTSLGDWFVNTDKLPGGLSYLTEELNKMGMKFGIWFEPEMVCMESKLYAKHPDWMIQIPGRTPCPSRNQYVLDMSNPDVVDYVWKMLSDVLHSASIDYVKWDMNRSLSDLGSSYLPTERQGELTHRYMLGVYELQERLITEFPELLLENCSSGGARFDPGMLYYSPQIWCSDDTDGIERLGIQEGTALVFPLSTMGAHVSDCPNHVLGRSIPFETRGHIALAGTFGYELDVTKISEKERNLIPRQVELYHKHSELVRDGDYYRVASYLENHYYDFYGVVSKDKKRALFTYVQVLNRPNYKSRIVKIPGLLPERKYSISGYEGDFYGSTLAKAGICIDNPKGDFISRLLEITEVSC